MTDSQLYNRFYYLRNKHKLLQKMREKRGPVVKKERPKIYKIKSTRIRSSIPKNKLNQFVYNKKLKGGIKGKPADFIVRDDKIILEFD
jgi:hypothetical protein